MLLKVFLLTIVAVGLLALAMGIKLIFNKTANQLPLTCKDSFSDNKGFSCGCGEGMCMNKPDMQNHKS